MTSIHNDDDDDDDDDDDGRSDSTIDQPSIDPIQKNKLKLTGGGTAAASSMGTSTLALASAIVRNFLL